MPKLIKPLTVKQLNSPAESSATNSKPTRLADGKGLYIFKYPSGKKTWYARYTIKGTKSQKLLLLGDYPEMSAVDARAKNLEVKQLANNGIDPKLHFAQQSLQEGSHETFEAIAKKWLAIRRLENKKDNETVRRLKNNILPKIGKQPFAQLSKNYIKEYVIDPIVERGAYEEAERNRTVIKMVFDYAIDFYDLDINNPASRIKTPKAKKGNFPAITVEQDLKQLVKDIWSYRDKYIRANIHVAEYLKLAIILFIRPSELRNLTWDNYDESNQELKLTLTKTNTQQIIRLPVQAQEILKNLQKYKFSKYIFPSHLSKKMQPISDNAARASLNRLGYKGKQSVHGFRSTARTLLDERLNQDVRYIENQLGHVPRDTNGKAYNRTQYLEQRGELLQLWANYLDALRLDKDINKFIKNNCN